jgi:hypothetical protein
MFNKKKKHKKIEPKCKNCRLFDSSCNLCKVVILHEGEKTHLPVESEDNCFFESKFMAVNPTDGKHEVFRPEVQQIKFWVEDVNGQKTNQNGTVKIEYPKELSGEPDDNKTE